MKIDAQITIRDKDISSIYYTNLNDQIAFFAGKSRITLDIRTLERLLSIVQESKLKYRGNLDTK